MTPTSEIQLSGIKPITDPTPPLLTPLVTPMPWRSTPTPLAAQAMGTLGMASSPACEVAAMDADPKATRRRTALTGRPLVITACARDTWSRSARISSWDWNKVEVKSHSPVVNRFPPTLGTPHLAYSQERGCRLHLHPPHLQLLPLHQLLPLPLTWLSRLRNFRNFLTVPMLWLPHWIFCKGARLGCIASTLTTVCYVYHFCIRFYFHM